MTQMTQMTQNPRFVRAILVLAALATIGVSAQRSFGSRLSVNLAASRLKLKREFAPPGFALVLSGTTYGGGVSYNIGSRIAVSANANRSIRPSGRPGKLYDIAQGANVAVNYRLGSRFDIILDQSFNKVVSNQDTLTPLLVITSSRVKTTTATINYSQSSRLNIGLSLRHDDRQTNLPQFDYTSTTVGLRAGTTF